VDYFELYSSGLCYRDGTRDFVGDRDCIQSSNGYERDALGDCIANHTHIGNRTDDHSGFQLRWVAGDLSQSNYKCIFELFPCGGRHGERLA